jgi:endonuclease/exonuclease/phosphatase (EEP) superfamily protein YafD
VITHLQRPDITSTALWRQHVTWAANQCTGNSLAVGDFNATVDDISPSRTLGGCVDSATALGPDPQGTWPTVLPGSLGATIDHVFTGPSWKPAAFSVLDGLDRAGSDHRPTFAVLTRAS